MADRVQEAVATDTATAVPVTVGLAAGLLVAARPSRVAVTIYNNGTATVYIGATAQVSTTTGFPLLAGASVEERDYTGQVWAVSGAAGQDVRVWETG